MMYAETLAKDKADRKKRKAKRARERAAREAAGEEVDAIEESSSDSEVEIDDDLNNAKSNRIRRGHLMRMQSATVSSLPAAKLVPRPPPRI